MLFMREPSPLMQQGLGQIGPYGMGMGGGFNPYQQAPSYDMYLMQQMGGGFNPYQQGFGGGGFNPYQQMMGGGFNPYQQGFGGGGFNPYQQGFGGGFNPYQQMGGGFNPYQQMMGGGFNPYQQMMGGGFNPYQQGLNPSIPGMGGFGQFTAPAPRNPYASIRQDMGPRPMPQQTTYTPSPMPMERPVNEAALDMGALPIRDFMPPVAEPAQPTPAAGMGPPAAQQRKYMEIFSTPARPQQQQFQPTGSADMVYGGPGMTPQQRFAREQQRMGMQQQAMGTGMKGPPAPTQFSMGQNLSMGPQQPSVQNASNQAAGGQPARLF